MSTMRYLKFTALCVAMLAVLSSGCAGPRNNLYYNPGRGEVSKLDNRAAGVIFPVSDARENTKIYPKQIIIRTSYGGDLSFDINDREVAEVFEDALAGDLGRLGVRLSNPEGLTAPLTRDNAAGKAEELRARYPEAQIAFGVTIKDFIAESQRTLIAYNISVKASIELVLLDIQTGDVLWGEYKSEYNNTTATADRNDLVEHLNAALVELMDKAVRKNMTLRDLLVKVANR